MSLKTRSIYRVLDANTNRLREALRVCEDIARFVIASPSLAKRCRYLRHQVTGQLQALPVPYKNLIDSRNSEEDVGKKNFRLEPKGGKVTDIAVRNFKRAQEAARVIEEFLKLIDPKRAYPFQKIRFQIYELEKKTLQRV